VGSIVVLADSTVSDAEEARIVLLLVFCGSLLVVGLFFFYGYMGRLEAGLKKAYSGLAEEVESRKIVEKELREYEGHLEQLVLSRTVKLQESNDSLLQEMTERKGVEKKLIQARDQWEKSFNAIGDIITIQDVEMNIIQANRAAHVFFAEEQESIHGRKCYELFCDQTTPCAGCPVTQSHIDKGSHTDIIHHERLGKIFAVTAAPVFDADGELQYFVHVARDLTHQKKLENDLLQARKMEAIGTLAGGIAHDFNNILSAILGYCELAKQHLPSEMATAAREDIDQIILSGQRAGSLVKQILDVSRKTEQSLQSLQPHLIVDEVVRLLRSTLPSSVEIVSDIDPASGLILADPTKIHQIVMNLCTNGCLLNTYPSPPD
jgi:PAS domain S-box-containing protein